MSDGSSVVLLTGVRDSLLQAAAASLVVDGVAPHVVATLDELRAACGKVLVSFGTSVIVPPDIIERFDGGAFNVHAASPDYPGRDPHHFAIYDGVGRYGATLHVMTDRVDDGPILDVEWFDVPAGCTPQMLLNRANDASMRLLGRHGRHLANGRVPQASTIRWGSRKRSRADFRAMCAIPADIAADEFERRLHAFDGGEYDNLTIQLHGWTFRIDKQSGRKR